MFKKHTKYIGYILVGLLILGVLYALKNTNYFIRCIGFVVSIFLFFMGDKFLRFRFKKNHYYIIILISVFGIMLSPLYYISPFYDKALHLIFPTFVGILVFFLVNKLEIKFSVKLTITFCVIIAILAIHEIVEYFLDWMFDFKLQGVYFRDYPGLEKLNIIMDKNNDTMIDLGLGVLGSLIFIFIKTATYWYKKLKLKN